MTIETTVYSCCFLVTHTVPDESTELLSDETRFLGYWNFEITIISSNVPHSWLTDLPITCYFGVVGYSTGKFSDKNLELSAL